PDHRRDRVQLPQDVRRRLHGLLAAAARRRAGGACALAAHRHRRHRRAAPRAVSGKELTVSLLVTKDLVKWFGGTHAVDRVNFTVQESEVLALIGSNGAGKTTLVNLISGLFRPDGGQIIFRDADVTHQSVHGRIKAGIARSFQLVNLFDQLTALDNVALTIFSREGKIANLAALAVSDSAVWDEAHEILRRFGLDAKARTLAGGVSQGERKLLDVAVAFALRPKLLFLDEPTSGVSTREKAPIM